MTAGRTLKLTLIVRHPDTDSPVGLIAGEPLPEWATGLVHPDDVAGGEASDGGYADLKVPELQAEIERRNEGRDDADLVTPDGTKKADLIAALKADDQARQS